MPDPLSTLKHELALKSAPRLAKCKPSRREYGERRAAAAFRFALESCGLTQRAAARWLCVDERLVRDWLSGSRAIPSWAPLALPREGQIAFLRAAAEDIPIVDESDDGEETERRTA